MNKPMKESDKFINGNTLVDLGYRDYIAARFLLNHEFVVQGLTLASTAIEKYLKSIIVITSNYKERYNYHMDNLSKLKTILSKLNHDVTKLFDSVFLEILENVYKIRYYDRIEKPIFIGLYLNQFIGELDQTIDFLENYVMKVQGLTNTITPYQRAIRNNDPNLFDNNFVLRKQDKKEFMETPDCGFSISIQINSSNQIVKVVKSENLRNEYDGKLKVFDEFKKRLLVDRNANNYR